MRLFIVIILSITLLTVCSRVEEKISGEQGGKLFVGTNELITSLSPLNPSVFGSNDILDLLYMHMHHLDPVSGKMRPELATSWEFSEDLTSITYYLRDDVKWSDGQSVTAEDVVYTFEIMKDPKFNYPNIASLRFINEVKIVGTNAVKFTFDRVYADLLTDSDLMVVPKHIHSVKLNEYGTKTIVSNGPYKVKEWIYGSMLVLEANKEYYRGKPPLDEINILFYSDATKMITDFAEGNLDIVMNLTPNLAKNLEKNQNIVIDSRPGNSYLYIGWNLANNNLKDKDIRKAISKAINTKRILDDIYLGMGSISLGPLPPSSWGYNESIEEIKFNLPEARRMLESKGFEDRNRNNIFDRERIDFTLNIITNVENPDRVRILDYVVEDLKALGIRVNARKLDTRSFIEALVKRDFDGFIMGWSVMDKIDPTMYWNSDPVKGKFNFTSYTNTFVDSLIDNGVAMLNRKGAKELWNQFQSIIYNDQPYTFLVVPNIIAAVHKRLRGADYGVVLANTYTYWIPEAERRIAVAIAPPPPVEVPSEEVEVKSGTDEKPKPTIEPKPTEVVTPEKLLEAAVKKETTAVAVAPPDTQTVTPRLPPKPAVITKPTPTKQITPVYPEKARSIGATGRIVVKVTVGVDGKVLNPVIVSSFGNPACEAAAIEAAKKWEFKPATKDGEPFEQQISIPFDFRP